MARCTDLLEWEYNGKRKSLAAWAIEFNRSYGWLYKKLENYLCAYGKCLVPFHDYKLEAILNFDLNSLKQHFEYNGETHTIRDWSKITGISQKTLRNRLFKLNWSVEEALTKPVIEYKKRKSNGSIVKDT